MSVDLQPARALRGAVSVPGDKSISHRAIILNGLARGRARVRNFLDSADCRSTIGAMRALGVRIEHTGDAVIVDSPGRRALHEPEAPIDCGNSGTTMRLLAGVAAGLDALTLLTGDASLRRRPMDRVLQPLARMGARVDGRAGGRLPPITIRGGALHPFQDRLTVASGQVKSAILLAGLAADGPTRLEEIATTRDHSERLLLAMGVLLERHGRTVTLAPPDGDLAPVDVDVPGDLSAAAFWLVAGSIVPGAEIALPAVGINPTRSGVLDVLQAMGADVRLHNQRLIAGEPVADLTVRAAPLRGTAIEGALVARSIDELPVLAVAAACAAGVTEVRGAEELRIKESDRIHEMAVGLAALGARIQERPDGWRIEGGGGLRGGAADSVGDHRLAMAFAVAALAADGPTRISGEESVAISYPRFWRDLQSLTGARAPAQA